jgi:hypothetical protein
MTMHVNGEELVSYLYDEAGADERAQIEAHLAQCADCRAELESLRILRTGLGSWTPPERELGFTIVSRSEPVPSGRRWWVPAWGLAAAAALVLAASAAIANLEVRYGDDGLTVRTGWGRSLESGVAADRSDSPAAVSPPAPETAWRSELAALEQRLRRDFAEGTRAASARTGAPRAAVAADGGASADLLRRVQALIDASESRQQRELALRVAQLVRDFDRQRQADLLRIQHGFGQLEGTTAADRELLNYLVRVSQQR